MSLLHHLRRLLAPRSHGAVRSNRWRTVERHHLAAHPECAACGRKGHNQVHHQKPFHERPDLELDEKNLLTLCPVHHLVFGHADSWRAINPHVVEDSATHQLRVERRGK
jgi:5-methylcytosine-specific restriction endonuclease McrA